MKRHDKCIQQQENLSNCFHGQSKPDYTLQLHA